MVFLVVRALLVSMAKNKSWHSNLVFAVIIRKYQKTRRNKFGIYATQTSYYGHVQHEKKLHMGAFFRAEYGHRKRF